MTTRKLPKFIAICGKPKSGKTLVQEFLAKKYGVIAVDDAAPIRQAATSMFIDIGKEDCWTQEGKKKTLELPEGPVQVREILGWMGNWMEETFGKDIMPYLAVKNCEGMGDASFSFGSVRRDQGKFYQSRGGIVIEVVRNGIPESPFEFDRYDKSVVDFQIYNNGSIEDLEKALDNLCSELSLIDK